MKFLFLGGSGNLSSVVLLDLLRNGHQVDCITRGNNTHFELKAAEAGANFLHFIDLADPTFYESCTLSSDYDVVIDFISYNKSDLASKFRLLCKHAPRLYVFISTTAMYSRSTYLENAYTEDNFLCLKEWAYAYDKYLAELFIQECSKNSSQKILTIRLGHTIGSSVPVFLGNPGHAFLEHLLSSKPIPWIGKANHPWSIGTASGLSQLFNQLPNVLDKLPHHMIFHYSGLVTTWSEMMASLCNILNIDLNFKYLAVPQVKKVVPEWLPSIIYHKMYPDIYDISRLKQNFLTPHHESLDKILHKTVDSTLSLPKESNYQKNVDRMNALDKISI